MTILTGELEYVKSNWITRVKAAINELEVGDDGTTPTESDTGVLGTVAGGTAVIESLDESVADQLTWTSKYGITSFVGSTIREVIVSDGSTPISRDLTVESLKGADQIFWLSPTAGINSKNI